MTERAFGGRTLAELKELRRNPADGAVFYTALLAAAPDLFQLADDYETLEAFVQDLVENFEKAADPSIAEDQRAVAMDDIKDTLGDPKTRKIFPAL